MRRDTVNFFFFNLDAKIFKHKTSIERYISVKGMNCIEGRFG